MFCEIIRPHGARDARYIHHRTRRDRPLHAPRSELQEDRAYDGRGDANARPLTAPSGHLGNDGRNDLPGLPPEVFLSKYALPKVVLVHSSRSLRLAKAVARRRNSVAVIASHSSARCHFGTSCPVSRAQSRPRVRGSESRNRHVTNPRIHQRQRSFVTSRVVEKGSVTMSETSLSYAAGTGYD